MFLRPRYVFPAAPKTPALPVAGIIFILGMLAGAVLSSLFAPTGAAPQIGDRYVPALSKAGESRLTAEVLRVVDGDTFEARVHVWPGIDITTKVRLRGIDAPEMKANCRDEALRADASRLALQSMLAQGGVTVSRVTPDKYGGRVVADASSRTTPDISAAMLEMGHARAYSGGRRDGWCG